MSAKNRIGWRGSTTTSPRRRAYQHRPERFDEFATRYKAELRDNPGLEELRKLTRRGVVTVVTATRDTDISQAAVLAELLKSH